MQCSSRRNENTFMEHLFSGTSTCYGCESKRINSWLMRWYVFIIYCWGSSLNCLLMSRKQATKDVPVKQHKEIIANAFRWSYIKKKTRTASSKTENCMECIALALERLQRISCLGEQWPCHWGLLTSKALSDIQLLLVYLKPIQANKQVICIEEGF